MRRRTVIVNDKMQQGYRYILSEPIGRNFDPEFRPELTPQQMLRLGYTMGRRMPQKKRRQIKRWKAMRRHGRQIERLCEPGHLTGRGATKAGSAASGL